VFSCSGKTALVTDASERVGRAAALALANAGAQVLLHHHRKAVRAQAAVEEIRKVGGKALAITGDLAATDGASELAKRAREIVGERLDVLVVNATATEPAAIADATADRLDAPFSLIRHLLPILGRGSSIIFTSPSISVSSPGATTENAPITASIANLVNHLAPLLLPGGIRVNAIAPIARSSQRRRLQSLGATITFLASDAASRITGETLRIEARPGSIQTPVGNPVEN
jgi:NAD(P)-dependent dehydrogenase (short-subunit alcohol dehydrogenase family)